MVHQLMLCSHSAEETLAIGRKIGTYAQGGSILAFKGDLGAGKTTMTKGIAQGLGIEDVVTSPTYTIISEYQGRLKLVHIDAYRLDGDLDFTEIGGYELIGQPDSICVIEWSERLQKISTREIATVDIHVRADGSREIKISGAWLTELLG